MEEIEIRADLEERKLQVGEVEIALSNYDIKHLRLVWEKMDGSDVSNSGESFGKEPAERAVGNVVEVQISSFIKSTGRDVNRKNIEKEVKEAFSTHLYSLADPD
ncbi:MAG: hypothetical protein SVV03_01490 [Candidatus Nanohaloarchaea archaeon]|nr:hypothetical protein [Candidatus Nanohaloarchaea archaeon]